MRATLMYGAGDIRVENVPDPVLQEPTDALVRVLRRASAAATCGPTRRCRPEPAGGWGTSSSASSRTPAPRSPGSARRRGRRAVRVVRRHLRLLSRRPAHLLPPRRLVGPRRRRRPGRGRPRPVGRRHPGEAARRRGLRLLPSLLTLSDVFGTGHHAAVTAGVEPAHHGHRHRRRRRRPVRGAGRQAARRRADHPHGPAHRTAPTSAASSAPPTSSPSAARTASGGARADRRRRRPRRARVRRHRAAIGRRRRGRATAAPSAGSARRSTAEVPIGFGTLHAQHHPDRRRRARPRLHPGTAARRPRRHRRPGRCSTAPSGSTRCPTATEPWPTARPSRSSSRPNAHPSPAGGASSSVDTTSSAGTGAGGSVRWCHEGVGEVSRDGHHPVVTASPAPTTLLRCLPCRAADAPRRAASASRRRAGSMPRGSLSYRSGRRSPRWPAPSVRVGGRSGSTAASSECLPARER